MTRDDYDYHPQYYTKFECSGDKCKDTCCRGWTINVDKLEYEAFKKHPGEFSERILKGIVKTNDESYSIKLNENNECSFLSKEGLCSLQLEYGHEILPELCKSYPRRFINVNNKYEVYLTTSCHEAAEKVLLSSETMSLTKGKVIAVGRGVYAWRPNTERYPSITNGTDIYLRVRKAIIEILQYRRYPLWRRVLILGFFVDLLDGILLEDAIDEIEVLCEVFIKNLVEGFYDEIDEQIEDNPSLKAKSLLSIIDELGNIDKTYNLILPHLECLKQAFGISHDIHDNDKFLRNFTEAHEKHYLSFFRDKDYFWENYVLNTVFINCFPFDFITRKTIFENYINLISKYLMLKLLITGVCGYYKDDFDEDKAIDCVVYFSRITEHSVFNNLNIFTQSESESVLSLISMLVRD